MFRKLSVGVQYTVVSTLYWVSYTVINAFQTVYLYAKGFSYTQIGWMLAFTSVLTIVFQSVPAALCDKHYAVSQNRVLACLAAASTLFALLQLLAPHSKWGICVCFMLMMGLCLSLFSAIYAVAMEYMNSGCRLNFGASRAVGSAGYAAVSIATGVLLERFPIGLALVLYIATGLACGIASALAYDPRLATPRAAFEAGTAQAGQGAAAQQTVLAGYRHFLVRYKVTFLLLGYLLMCICSTSLYNYQYAILNAVGGGEQALGIACGIGAACEIPFMVLFARLRRRFSLPALLRFSSLLYAVKAALFLLAHNVPLVWAANILQGPSYGIFSLAASYHINEVAGTQDKAKGQALLGIVSVGLTGILSNLLSGSLLEGLGVRAVLVMCLGTGTLGVCLVWLYTRLFEKRAPLPCPAPQN